MPVIRFVREGRDVECYPGENLREVALREGIEMYGLKGKLGNCGGCGQCITCFVEVVGESSPGSLTPRTGVEERKLQRTLKDGACRRCRQKSRKADERRTTRHRSGLRASGVWQRRCAPQQYNKHNQRYVCHLLSLVRRRSGFCRGVGESSRWRVPAPSLLGGWRSGFRK